MRVILNLCLIATALTSCAPSLDKKQEQVDAAKLVGKWKWAEKKGKYPGTIEFRDDGTMTARLVINGEGYSLLGKYRVEGNKVIIVLRDDREHDEVYTVSKLTDNELVWTDEKENEEEHHSRVKDE